MDDTRLPDGHESDRGIRNHDGLLRLLMPFASTRFLLQSGKLDLEVALGLTLGGLPALLIAALLVKSLPLHALKWLVIVVVLVTACQCYA